MPLISLPILQPRLRLNTKNVSYFYRRFQTEIFGPNLSFRLPSLNVYGMESVNRYAFEEQRIEEGNSVKKLVALFLALSCSATQASLIEYNDYTLDTDTAIVTGGALEWLQWTETQGLSIAEVTASTSSYTADGWRLASYAEMGALFNSWQLGDMVWDEQETLVQHTWLASSHIQQAGMFTSFFGITQLGGYKAAKAIFGQELNKLGTYNYAEVYSEGYHVYDGWAGLLSDHPLMDSNYSGRIFGIALVRDLPSVSVPEPASLGLLVVGLAGIAFRRWKV